MTTRTTMTMTGEQFANLIAAIVHHGERGVELRLTATTPEEYREGEYHRAERNEHIRRVHDWFDAVERERAAAARLAEACKDIRKHTYPGAGDGWHEIDDDIWERFRDAYDDIARLPPQ